MVTAVQLELAVAAIGVATAFVAVALAGSHWQTTRNSRDALLPDQSIISISTEQSPVRTDLFDGSTIRPCVSHPVDVGDLCPGLTFSVIGALKKLEPDWWIELESTYRERIDQRKKLYAEHGKLVIDELPGSREASRECMEMAIQYVCQRYPNQFHYDNRTGLFFNNILGVKADINAIHPLVLLLEHIPEDFFITQEDPETGLYVLRAAVSCSAVGWNVSQKIGRPLHQIHGPVPDYKEKMAFSMDRFFSKMPCNKPIQRGSWGLEVGEPLFVQTDEPGWKLRQMRDPDLSLSNVHLRVDWQTLRRMPKSRAIVFNFKAFFTPITDFRREPYVPKLVLKVLLEGNKSIMEYKGTWHIEHKVIPALREWAKEQEETGLVSKGWEERTLDEDPFYPGWKDHYRLYS